MSKIRRRDVCSPSFLLFETCKSGVLKYRNDKLYVHTRAYNWFAILVSARVRVSFPSKSA